MPMLIDNPTELGADRLCDSIAAFERYNGPCIVVDFGTATKFEVISARGEYLGGAIAPGLGLSADALFNRAARLARVDIKRPAKVIGTNTVGHLQSGLYFGYIGLVDGILERILAELKQNDAAIEPRIVATGGLARLIAGDSRFIHDIDEWLTIDGLRILFERNRNGNTSARMRSRPR
jgi:type III pantothenate kinase